MDFVDGELWSAFYALPRLWNAWWLADIRFKGCFHLAGARGGMRLITFRGGMRGAFLGAFSGDSGNGVKSRVV